tara:strand:- start:3865 stop:4335 length:471 start_codon:yes stop_codon:yes gene_type:complete
MKVIFLDIDGVINNAASIMKPGLHTLNPACVERLNRLCDETGAVVVVSSTWRKVWPLVALQQRFEEYGFTGRLVDRTPIIRNAERGQEIASYLSDCAIHGYPIERWVILDDNTDMGPLLGDLVKTDHQAGLTEEDMDRAREKLNGKNSNNFMATQP